MGDALNQMVVFLAGMGTMHALRKLSWMQRKTYTGTKKKDDDGEEWVDDDIASVSSEESDGKEGGAENFPPISDAYEISDFPFKMVLVVNQGLGMTKGKIAAQCGHATLGAYKRARAHSRNVLRFWEHTGQAKVAVKGTDDAVLIDVQRRAREKGLVTYRVRDAGRTQIPAGSMTVVAIGPAPVSAFGDVTDGLKLL